MNARPLLMIPGPVEISEGVLAAAAEPPRGHLAPDLMASMASALKAMRAVWRAGPEFQPFVVPGGGTLAMEMAATNLVGPGDRAVVVNTGYFSDRMAEMLRRRGALVREVRAEPGQVPAAEAVARALGEGRTAALFATHVDTSTGVRVDAESLCALAREHGVLSCFDGVCATAGERFEMEAWGAGVYLTSSQKAIGLPAGLALMVASPPALEARERLAAPPPLTMDWKAWQPVMQAYEEGRPAYFATPATTLVRALEVGLGEILAGDHDPAAAVSRRIERHALVARSFRAAWDALGLVPVPAHQEIAAHTLSALRFPPGIGPDLVGRVRRHGVIVAGGLHPAIKDSSFRVGHMGAVIDRRDDLLRTARAIGLALHEGGARADADAAVAAMDRALG